MLLILVGEGQEIYNGENAGIQQWNTAINKGVEDWEVVCPDKLLPVFGHDQRILKNANSNSLDLTVSLRTHLAGDVSDFVNDVIDGKIKQAAKKAPSIFDYGFTMLITRNLEKAKEYCDSRYKGNLTKRYGLLASSKAKGLSSYGVDNSFYGTKNTDFGKWFNTPKGSGSSCCDYRQVVTEFGCQGLELDMPIVCWGSDMSWNGHSWDKFKPAQHDSSDENVFRINSYRVLLTRGRDGFIVFVPPVSALESVYNILKEAGMEDL